MSTPAPKSDFEIWWHNEGSGMPPVEGEDREPHMRRVAEIAWSNGAYLAKEKLERENAALRARIEEMEAQRRNEIADAHWEDRE